MYLDGDRRPALTPQLAIRVAVIGGVALLAFGVIFFRLWYLQVLSGDRYLAEANDNQLREIKVQAPRGEIVDREGRELVENRSGLAIKVRPDKLPDDRAERRVLYRRLGKLLGRSPARIERDVNEDLESQKFASATVKQDVPAPIVYYLLEHKDDYPAVDVEQVFLRKYPHKEVGAHLFGTVGEVSEDQLGGERYRGVQLGDRIGKSGIEQQYDRFLRGRNGARRLQVDALGNLKGSLSERRPQQGRQLRLSVDLDVQRAGQEALAAGTGKGAFVAMDVNNGEVLAMGSQPSFDPNVFARQVRASDYKRLTAVENGAPLTNRAIQGLYPTGSTFKLVTAAAALEGGAITPDTVQYDGGSLRVGGVTFQNAGGVSHGAVALRQALTVSSDVFFYLLGRDLNGRGNGLLLQHWSGRLGIGRRTGIDLPAELPGRVPSPKWRNDLFKKKLTDRPWSIGDNINLSVGQGDIAASPLQMAVAYAAVANGGRVLRPRLGSRIEDASGRVLQQLEAPTARRLKIKPEHRQAILDGVRGAASGPGGTSTSVFKGFPIQIAGKTGTAEKGAGRADQSWYVALAPWPDIKYVVAVTDEAGGFGAETAAPMARKILAELFEVKETKLVEGGSSQD
ncbi:MAG TPA: penicillin-binding protein 2 [Thermoleophilaceae bacterium]|nr:penicillin-binding protein 2 [Thermoleophilaceae bacterium]